ncbi:MAG: hypothetical protein ACP5N1_02570 [Candidatus Woesearchaeota archaeon]
MRNNVKADIMSEDLVQKLINATPEVFRRGLGIPTLQTLELNYLQYKKNTISYEIQNQKKHLTAAQWNPLIIANINSFIHGIDYTTSDNLDKEIKRFTNGIDVVKNRITVGVGEAKYTDEAIRHSSLIHCADKINKHSPFVGSCMGLTNITAYLASKENIPLKIEVKFPKEGSGHIRLALEDNTPIENTSTDPFGNFQKESYQQLPLDHIYFMTLYNLRTELNEGYKLFNTFDTNEFKNMFNDMLSVPEIQCKLQEALQTQSQLLPSKLETTEFLQKISQQINSSDFRLKTINHITTCVFNTLDQMTDEFSHVDFDGKNEIVLDVANNYFQIAKDSYALNPSKSHSSLVMPNETALRAYQSCRKLYGATEKSDDLINIIKEFRLLPGMRIQSLIDKSPLRGLHSTNRINLYLDNEQRRLQNEYY